MGGLVSDVSQVTGSLEDPRQFEQFVATHSTRVHAYLARRTAGHADDLLSEVWLAAFAARRTYDPDRGEAVGWLFGIARNVLMTHLRTERRRSARDRDSAHLSLDRVDEWAAVDERLDAAGSVPALREALAALPAEERDVLLLVAWEQLTPSEVAEALGIPPGTARSRLHRARNRIASGWDDTADAYEREAIL